MDVILEIYYKKIQYHLIYRLYIIKNIFVEN